MAFEKLILSVPHSLRPAVARVSMVMPTAEGFCEDLELLQVDSGYCDELTGLLMIKPIQHLESGFDSCLSPLL